MATITSIWKDTYYTVNGDASPFVYSITVGNETIFNGKAYVAPDEQEIKIKVNDICKDYLEMTMPALVAGYGQTEHTNSCRQFLIKNEGGTVLDSFDFTMDWSYEIGERDSNNREYLSKPINYHGTSGMFYLRTIAQNGKNVTASSTSAPSILFNHLKYYNSHYCGNYALYYLNSYGGWDSFLIEGNVKRTDEYNRLAISTPFNNNTYDWGKRNYNNQITPKFEITTGYLTDTESEIFAKNLLRSNQVYLHDIVRGKIWPVVLTDAEGQFKTFKTNGRRFITYTFNANASQTEQNIS